MQAEQGNPFELAADPATPPTLQSADPATPVSTENPFADPGVNQPPAAENPFEAVGAEQEAVLVKQESTRSLATPASLELERPTELVAEMVGGLEVSVQSATGPGSISPDHCAAGEHSGHAGQGGDGHHPGGGADSRKLGY